MFAWYKVTIDDGQEILSDTDTRPTLLWLRDSRVGNFSKDPKELKKQKLKAATAKLLSDPNIEAVEFNFVVRTLLQVTPHSFARVAKIFPMIHTLVQLAHGGKHTQIFGALRRLMPKMLGNSQPVRQR